MAPTSIFIKGALRAQSFKPQKTLWMVHLPSTPGRLAQLRGVAATLTSGGFAVYKPEHCMLSIILSLYTLALPWEVERVLHSESSLEVLGRWQP